MVEQGADTFPCCLDGSLSGFSQECLELGEELLDWIEVGAVRRQEEQLRTACADRAPYGLPLVAAEIVHDDDVARRQSGNEELLDPSGEDLAVDRSVEDAGRIDPVVSQGREQGQCPPLSKGRFGVEAFASPRSAMRAGHVSLGPCFVDEDETFRVKTALILPPLRATPGDRRPILLAGEQAFF